MRLALLRFDGMVTVPGGKLVGDGMCTDACETEYRAADGWELYETSPGVFSLRAPHMLQAFTWASSDYGYFPSPVEPAVAVEAQRGKRR